MLLRSLHLPSRLIAILLVISTLLSACSRDKPPAGRILVKNDSQDSEYNVISVSGGGAQVYLKPGERFVLPKATRSFSVQRRYENFTRSYSVVCPAPGSNGVFIKLIDIHVNRIAGGCKTVSASKQ